MRIAYLKKLRKKYQLRWAYTLMYGKVLKVKDRYGFTDDMYLSPYEFIHMSLIKEGRFMAAFCYKARKQDIIKQQKLKLNARARNNR
jgi:hypothetical protein